METTFEWLQKWYQSQCNEDWEHEFGIKIETIDNPGWYVEINLTDTKFEQKFFHPTVFEKNENDWYFCVKKNNNFEASCSSCNLEKVLSIFRDWIEATN